MLPILLNLYLWLGKQLSLAPFLSRMHGKLVFVASLLEATPLRQEQLVIHMMNADMRARLAVLSFVPVLPLSALRNDLFTSDQVIYIREATELVAAVIIINLIVLIVSSIFLTVLAGGVRNERWGMRTTLRKSLVASLRIIGAVLAVIVLALVTLLPLLILATLVLLQVLETPGPILFIVWFVIGFWVYLYTGFAIEAIVVSGVGPIRAVLTSIRVVQRHFFSTIGLLLLSLVIVSGLQIVWYVIAGTPIGTMAAIVGSAYVGSGLEAARMVFYRDRVIPDSDNQGNADRNSE
jgi:hypothetical protein